MNDFKEFVNKIIEEVKGATKKGYKNEDLFCLCYTLALIRAFEHGREGIFETSLFWVSVAGETIYREFLKELEHETH